MQRGVDFYGFQSPWWLGFCALAVVAAMVLIVVLLRYERRLVSRRVGWSLVVLRLAVLATVLLTFLEPVLTWSLSRTRKGRIVVALDLSESMDTADRHAARAEKLRWARGLGMIGNEATNARIDRWIADLEAGKEPRWLDADENDDEEQARLLAESRKENLEGIFEEIDKMPRKEIARRLLLRGGENSLLAQLEAIADVELRVFAGNSESADKQTLEGYIDKPPEKIVESVSNLEEPLQVSGEGEATQIAGMVLFTDGRNNAKGDPIATAIRLRDRETPVFPVIVGSVLEPRDLSVAALDYPSKVFKDDELILKARFNTSGFVGQEVNVLLEREGEEPVVKTMTPEGPTHELAFDLDSDEIGRHSYTVRAEVQQGETRDDNNSRVFHVNVVSDKAQVLLVEGAARWEFRFIDNALTRDSRVDAEQVVFEQPFMNVQARPFFERNLDFPAELDNLRDSPFANVDMVVVGDVPDNEFPERSWRFLEKFVAESGGTLVLVSGKRHFPRDHRSDIVQKLLPVSSVRVHNETGFRARGAPTERGFHLKLTPEGEAQAMLQFDADPLENKRIWSELPGHLWGLIGTAKPNATVFARAVLPDANEDDLAAEREAAMIVHQHYGFGQVLWIGIDSTWRWRHRVGDKYHHRFWGQLARWAADRKMSAGNEFVRFGAERSDLEAGEDVNLRAQWTASFLKRFPDLEAKVEVYPIKDGRRASEPLTTIGLESVDTQPVVHEGRIAALGAGQYALKLVVDGADLGDKEIVSTVFVHAKLNAELSDLSADRTLLTRIAEASGGKLFLPDETAQLPDMFVSTEDQALLREEVSLWDHWLLMLVFFALMTGEWVVRKLNGLP